MTNQRRIATPARERLRKRLLLLGAVRLVTALVVLVPIFVWLRWAGPAVAPALLFGGLLGIGLVLAGSGPLGSFVSGTAGVSGGPESRLVSAELRHPRTQLLMALANTPFVVAVLLFLAVGAETGVRLRPFEYVPALLFAAGHVASVTSSAGYFLVAYALVRSER